MKQFVQITGLKPEAGDVGEHILMMQYEHLKGHIPLLYLTLCFYFCMSIVFLSSQMSPNNGLYILANFILPSIAVPFVIIRGIAWYRRRNDVFERKKVEKVIISLTLLSGFLAIVCGSWAVMAWQVESSEYRAYLALIMAMGGFSVAYCLAIVPFAANFNLLTVLLPLSLMMMFSGERFLMAIGAIMITAMVYLVALLRRHNKQMIQMITLQTQMHDLANTDTLTGLLNRRALTEEYNINVHNQNNSLTKNIPSEDDAIEITNITMVMIDLDGFKPINDEYGHATGDQLLNIMGKRMQSHIGNYGSIARIGGDEFAILFLNKPPQFCQQMIDSLSYILSADCNINDYKISVGVSYGLAHCSEELLSIEKLLSKADKELYIMKAQKNITSSQDVNRIIAL